MQLLELDKLRIKTDPLADNLIKEIIENKLLGSVNEFFQLLNKNSFESKGIPSIIKEYFRDLSDLPENIDYKKIRIAQDLYIQHGIEISMILLLKSLPQCYACKKGARVLYSTGRFVVKDDDFTPLERRLIETSQFIVNVLEPDSFTNKGKAIISAKKIRLIHAAIRYYIKKGEWDTNYYGEPINQEDLLGTLMSFSALTIEGLGQLNIDISKDEKDAYIYLWAIIGSALGIDSRYIPKNYEDSIKLGYAIFEKEAEYSNEGKELIDSAIDFVEKLTPLKMFDSFANNMMQYFLGDEISKIMRINKSKGPMYKIAPKILRTYFGFSNRLDSKSFLIRKASGKFSKAILIGMLHKLNKGDSVKFSIPPSLTKSWNIK
jgi:hypothetical protein